MLPTVIAPNSPSQWREVDIMTAEVGAGVRGTRVAQHSDGKKEGYGEKEKTNTVKPLATSHHDSDWTVRLRFAE